MSRIQFTEADILTSIQNGYNIIVAETLCIVKSMMFPQMGNQVYYPFIDYYPDILCVAAIYNFNNNRFLLPVDRRQFDLLRWDWELMTGEPQWFDPQNFRYTAIVPHLGSTPVGGFQVFYRAKADQLTLASVPSIPTQAIQAIENWATKEQFESVHEWDKATSYLKKYLELIVPIKKLARNIASPDKLNILAPSPRMGTYSLSTGVNELWTGNEIPHGTIDGSNNIFTLAGIPNPTSTILVQKNGQILYNGIGYTLSGNTLTFLSGYIPIIGDDIRVWYQV